MVGLAGRARASRTYVELFCREGPNADPGGVGLHHPVDISHVLGGYAQPGAHSTHGAVRGCHKGVRAWSREQVNKPAFSEGS